MNEWAGIGNHNTAEFWEYDTRTARRGNLDPDGLVWESSYATFGGNPIKNADISGNKWYDKLIGFGIATIQDAIPFQGLNNEGWRGWYSPTDAGDYYTGLNNGDINAMAMGMAECIIGGMGESGGGTLTLSIVGAEVGIPMAAAGMIANLEGVSTMANAASGMAWTQQQMKNLNAEQQSESQPVKAEEVEQQPQKQSTEGNNKTRVENQEQVQKENKNTFGGEEVTTPCFIAGTLVSTKQGLRPIEQIRAGDSIWAFNEKNKYACLVAVGKPFVKHTEHLVRLTINGIEIWTTPEHPFYVNSGEWIDAGNIRKGDLVWIKGGKAKLKVGDAFVVDSSCTVYNMYLSDVHTYWVSVLQVVVHNATEGGNTSRNAGKKAADGGKTSRKINEKRAESWADKEAKLRDALKEAKTKKDKAAIKKQIEHARTKQKSSEPHGISGQ